MWSMNRNEAVKLLCGFNYEMKHRIRPQPPCFIKLGTTEFSQSEQRLIAYFSSIGNKNGLLYTKGYKVENCHVKEESVVKLINKTTHISLRRKAKIKYKN